MVKPQVLAACPDFALPIIERSLGPDVELVVASRLESAQRIVAGNHDLRLVLCGVHFDESRMYDLLRYTRKASPDLPFICVRALDAEIPRISREAIRIAAESLGAVAFIDHATLSGEQGVATADAELRRRVFLSLRPAARKNA